MCGICFFPLIYVNEKIHSFIYAPILLCFHYFQIVHNSQLAILFKNKMKVHGCRLPQERWFCLGKIILQNWVGGAFCVCTPARGSTCENHFFTYRRCFFLFSILGAKKVFRQTLHVQCWLVMLYCLIFLPAPIASVFKIQINFLWYWGFNLGPSALGRGFF